MRAGRDRHRAGGARSATRSGARSCSPPEQSGVCAAGTGRCRRSADDLDRRGARARPARAVAAWRPTVLLGRGGGPLAAQPALGALTCRPSIARQSTAAVRAADTAPGVALRLAGGVAAGEVADRGGREVGAGARDLDGRGDPAGRGRGVPRSSPPRQRHGSRRRALAPGCHIRFRGEDLPPASSRGSRIGADAARISALASAGIGEVRSTDAGGLRLIMTGSELLRSARRPSRAGSGSRTDGWCGCSLERAGAW